MFDSLFVFAQRERPFRVIERVADSRRGIGSGGGGLLLGLLLTSDRQNLMNTSEDQGGG